MPGSPPSPGCGRRPLAGQPEPTTRTPLFGCRSIRLRNGPEGTRPPVHRAPGVANPSISPGRSGPTSRAQDSNADDPTSDALRRRRHRRSLPDAPRCALLEREVVKQESECGQLVGWYDGVPRRVGRHDIGSEVLARAVFPCVRRKRIRGNAAVRRLEQVARAGLGHPRRRRRPGHARRQGGEHAGRLAGNVSAQALVARPLARLPPRSSGPARFRLRLFPQHRSPWLHPRRSGQRVWGAPRPPRPRRSGARRRRLAERRSRHADPRRAVRPLARQDTALD
jgi:hypothetical protein